MREIGPEYSISPLHQNSIETMWKILSTLFAVAWSVGNAVNVTLPKENFVCMDDQNFKDCIRMLGDGLSKPNVSTNSLMSISAQVNTPADIEQLCQNYVKTNDCYQRNTIRQRCAKNVAIKALDLVIGYLCTPANKKVAMDKMVCFQNLVKTDPRMRMCTTQIADPCQDVIAKMRCMKPAIVESCGNEIFKFTAQISVNALKVANIDCDVTSVTQRKRRTATNQLKGLVAWQSVGDVLKGALGENNDLSAIMKGMLL